ncbi:hypothetical protein [uncultured Paludibaculum sp.]|uniref:hypothetical protein n=1 Tax=uncultured Paludibaculum sp. TaxID=1765020 RepID=UPI002AAB864D|nr:hypothetical protein [uncultured Paludibaculum sp.]
MRFSSALRAGALVTGLTVTVFGAVSQPPSEPAEPKYVLKDAEPIPPRAAPTDYQAQGKAGKVTIAADFTGHSMPGPTGLMTSEDYVAVEVGLYGAAGETLSISVDNFSLRINGKKNPYPSQPYGLLVKSLKDPDYEQPKKQESKSSIGGGGQPGEAPPPTTTVKLPIEVVRSLQQRIQKASLSEGERPLPQAGLLYFEYRGKAEKIKSLELIYDGPAGKATIPLM